jgi:hypothetical protein
VSGKKVRSTAAWEPEIMNGRPSSSTMVVSSSPVGVTASILIRHEYAPSRAVAETVKASMSVRETSRGNSKPLPRRSDGGLASRSA